LFSVVSTIAWKDLSQKGPIMCQVGRAISKFNCHIQVKLWFSDAKTAVCSTRSCILRGCADKLCQL